jgi:hypothetical protein
MGFRPLMLPALLRLPSFSCGYWWNGGYTRADANQR